MVTTRHRPETIWNRYNFPISMEGCVLYLPAREEDMRISPLLSYDQYHYSATVTEATWGSQGRTFDTVDDKIVTTSPMSAFTSNLTLIGWAKRTSLTGPKTIFDSTTGEGFGLGSGWVLDKWDFYLYLDSVWRNTGSSSSNVTYDVFHHLMATYDGALGSNQMKLVVDGVLEAQASFGGTITGTGDIEISKAFWGGTIGEGLAYTRTFSLAEGEYHRRATMGRYV